MKRKLIISVIILLSIFLYQKYFMWSWRYSTYTLTNPVNQKDYFILRQGHDCWFDWVSISESSIWNIFFINIDSSKSVFLKGCPAHYEFDSTNQKLIIYHNGKIKKIGKDVKFIEVKKSKSHFHRDSLNFPFE